MATSGSKVLAHSIYGDKITFNWRVVTQTGFVSRVAFTFKYETGSQDWVEFRYRSNNTYYDGMLGFTIYSSYTDEEGNTKTYAGAGNIFRPEDLPVTEYYDYYGDYTQLQGMLYNPNYPNTSIGSSVINKPTSFTYSGEVDVLRDEITNTGTLNFGAWIQGVTYAYVKRGTTGESNYILNGTSYFDSVSSTSVTVTTTTKFGSGAKVKSVTWENDEQDPVITYVYDRGSSVTSATLEACISFTGETDNIPYRPISVDEQSYTFNLTQEERETLWTLLQKGDTGSVRFKIRTSEVVGVETKVVENYLPHTFKFVNYKPTATLTVKDTNPATIAITGGYDSDGYPILVRHMSTVSYKVDAELRKGALDVIGGFVQNGSYLDDLRYVGEFDTFPRPPESNTFYFMVTDDRGHSSEGLALTIDQFYGNWVPYIKLTSIVKCTPISGEGNLTVTVSGKYYDKLFGSSNISNTMQYQYAIYPRGTDPVWSDIIDVTPTMGTDGDYSFSFPYSVGMNYTKQHNVDIRVIDRLMTSEVSTTAVARPTFYWGEDEFFFNVPVKINGADVPTITEQGDYFGWTYRKWTDGTAECWRNITIDNVNISNSTAGGWYASGNLTSTNLSFPFTFKERPTVTVTTVPTGTSWAIVFPGSTAGSTSQTGSFQLLGTSSTTAKSYILSYQVRGKWE